jgi:putative glutamine amidotransferase
MEESMTIRVAIPEPSSLDPEYNARSLPPYLAALRASGAEPVIIPLDEPRQVVARVLAETNAILLPGSRYDVDPESYGEMRIPECAEADPARSAADELMLEHSFELRKPILAICYGAQALNVWRGGSLIQHLETPVNHQPGRQVLEAHPVQIDPGSRLATLAQAGEAMVNSSHHQAIRAVGGSLRVGATSPADAVVEAVELDSPDHFVVAVQWHPERTFDSSALSRELFAEFIRAAASWKPRRIEESVAR